MPTEAAFIELAKLSDTALREALSQWEASGTRLVQLEASVDELSRVQTVLMSLRAAGISAILRVREQEMELEDAEALALFEFLRDWDQLLLLNVLEVCGAWLPAEARRLLDIEAVTEHKWFQEWQTAANDDQFKYPGLPWRSFMRKINAENYAFASEILRLGSQTKPGSQGELESVIRSFLIAKKKTVCIFPKRWNKKIDEVVQ